MFFGSFWSNFSYLGVSSQLDRLLDQKDVKLEQILDEDSFSQEVRNNSKKLSEHLIKNPQQLLELIDYIIKEPTQEMDEKKKFKYPFLTSELFNSQPSELINYLLGIKEDCGSSQSNEHDSGLKGQDNEDQDIEDTTDQLEETKQQEQENTGNEQNESEHNQPENTNKDEEKQSGDESPVQPQISNLISSNEETPEGNQISEEEKKEGDDEHELKVEDVDQEETTEQKPVVTQPQQPTVAATSSKDVLARIFSFFDVKDDKQLNLTNCGYFQKLIQMLISKQGHLWDHFRQTNTPILANMCKHLYSRSIAEIVLKLLTLEGIQKSNDEHEENEDFYKEQRLKLLQLVLDTYNNCLEEDEVFDNIQYIIVDILQNAANNTEKYPNLYLTNLVDKLKENDTKQIFLSKLKDKSKMNFYSVYFSLSILNQLVVYQTTEKRNQQNHDEGDTVEQDDDEFEFYSTNLSTLVGVFDARSLHIQAGSESEQRFGLVRLKLVELLHNLIKINDSNINQRLIDLQVLKILLDDFKHFHNHNVFHNFLEHIIETILLKNDCQKMKQSLLQTSLFQSFLQEVRSFQSEEVPKQTSNDSPRDQQRLYNNQAALRLNRASIKNTQSGFYYKFLNLYFERKSELRELIRDEKDLCKELDDVELSFYKNISDLNKYILGGEEHRDSCHDNEIDPDDRNWNQFDNHKESNNDDDDQDKDENNEEENQDHGNQHAKGTSYQEQLSTQEIEQLNYIKSELEEAGETRPKSSSIHDIQIEQESEIIIKEIKEQISPEQAYGSSEFWKNELAYELKELEGDLSQ